MLCKILRRNQTSSAAVADWMPASLTPAELVPAENPIEECETPAPAIAVAPLYARIRELEHALATEVVKARESGMREGDRAGYERAAMEFRVVEERMTQSISEMAGARAKLRRDAEADVVKLALAVARRVLRREIAVDEAALAGVIKAALERIDARDQCLVRVHPQQAGIVRAVLQRDGRTAEVVEDPVLAIGGLLFETERGRLDASVDTQLQEIERGLADRLGNK